MLLVSPLPAQFPFTFNGISTADIPAGLGSLKVLPFEGWMQIAMACALLEVRVCGPRLDYRPQSDALT